MPSASFYNNSAWLLGLDLHHVYVTPTSISEVVTGHRVESFPHLVLCKHSWPGGDESKRTPKLTACGDKMIRDGFTLGTVPHITAIVWPYEVLELAKIVNASKSTPFLKIATVTSAGDPLAVCCVAAGGFNLDCWDDGMKLSGIVVCNISVKTVAQFKDVLFKLFDDFLKKLLVKFLTKVLDKLLAARKVPWPIRPIVVWIAEKIIAKLVNFVEWALKLLWDVIQDATKDDPTPLPSPDFPEVPDLPDPPELPPPPRDWEEEEKEREERERKRDQEKRERNKPWFNWW